MHPDISHLAPLVGVWRGRGDGHYPTIESFAYLEEITIAHVGKPFLAYQQRTRHAETDLPLHAEAGYLRPVGLDTLELVIAQPSGIVEIDLGPLEVDGDRLTFDLHSSVVEGTPTAKEVRSVQRQVRVVGDTLTYDLFMGAVGQPHQHHLAAELHRVETES